MLAHTHEMLALGSRAPALAAAGGLVAGRLTGRRLPTPVRAWRASTTRTGGTPVALMADTFTRFLHPEVGDAAVRALEAAGAQVTVVDPGCCGRPLLSQGLVGAARRRVLRALDVLAPHAEAGTPIAVLEPSCWSMLADDALALVDDPRTEVVARACVSFEHAVVDLGLDGLAPLDADIVLHPHCHTRALGAGADLTRALDLIPGARVRESGAGCCGMAGAFGYLHPQLSRAVAADRLVPAMRGAAVAVAPGTSCRHQIAELAGVRALHTAELLASMLGA